MKKKYTKPQIIFESVSVSSSIAGDCDTIITNIARETCPMETRSGHFVFVSDLSACSTHEPDGIYDNICYHVPYEAYNLFNS